jgi:hypothetical protein
MSSMRILRLSFVPFLVLGLATAALAGPPAAIPNPDPAHQRAERSFDEFAKGWMQKMARLESQNRAKPNLASQSGASVASYRGYDGDYKIELKPTGSSTAPWVGILRYHELTYTCADQSTASCAPSKKMRVTEIFRFQGGKWVY